MHLLFNFPTFFPSLIRRTWRHFVSSSGSSVSNKPSPPKWDLNTFLSSNTGHLSISQSSTVPFTSSVNANGNSPPISAPPLLPSYVRTSVTETEDLRHTSAPHL